MPDFSFGQMVGLGAAGAGIGMGINLVGDTVNGLINNAFYRRNLGLQVQAQKDLIDYQNKYNAPSAQMQRLAEAGLNPHLVYGSAAPAGVSGNASAPSGHSPSGGFATPDVVASMLHIKQMEGINSSINLQNAQAEEARARANFTNTQNARYNEQIDTAIREAGYRMNQIASNIDVNQSTIQYQTAAKDLAEADAAYKRSEIGLQDYRRLQIIAMTNLYRSQEALNKANEDLTYKMSDNEKVKGRLLLLEEKYQQLMQDPEYVKKSRDEKMKILKRDAADAASEMGIVGSKFLKWYDWFYDQVERGSQIYKNLR